MLRLVGSIAERVEVKLWPVLYYLFSKLWGSSK